MAGRYEPIAAGDALSTNLKEAIASHIWYHTMELTPGVETPGYYDLRSIVDKLPWPDVIGKRCLDVATFDGFLAFQMERRGAREVVAIDVDDYKDLDWLPQRRAISGADLEGMEPGRGFRIAADALDSKVERRGLNVYELSPETVGMFDVVVCGSLMQHLRDPLRALEAIRSVCTGWFMSMEMVRLGLSLLYPRRPLTQLIGHVDTWTLPNAAGHARMLELAGFEVVKRRFPYTTPYGRAQREAVKGLKSAVRSEGAGTVARALVRSGVTFALTRHVGDVTSAIVARPRG
jgi:tRNA (mo5U34)-methyltransferase